MLVCCVTQVSSDDGSSDWLSAGTCSRLQSTGGTTHDGSASTATLETTTDLSSQLAHSCPTLVSTMKLFITSDTFHTHPDMLSGILLSRWHRPINRQTDTLVAILRTPTRGEVMTLLKHGCFLTVFLVGIRHIVT